MQVSPRTPAAEISSLQQGAEEDEVETRTARSAPNRRGAA